jgi:MFS family permease
VFAGNAFGADRLWLLTLCAARVGSAAPFQVYAGVLPYVQTEWSMSGSEAGVLAFAWQVVFALSLVALSWMADRVGARRVFLWSTWATVVATALVALLAHSFVSGLLLFSLLALVNGGTYTPGLMLLARFPSARRGVAIGWFLGAASLGYALALGIVGSLVRVGGWRGAVFAIAGFGGALAAITTPSLMRGSPGPDIPAAQRNPSSAGIVRGFLMNRSALLITVGYSFHAWELLGMWVWTPAFLTAVLASRPADAEVSGLGVGLSALFHLMGLVASGAAGWLSDRWGRTAVIIAMLVVSGTCSFGFGWMIAAPLSLVLAVGIIYSFSAIGDSAVFSTGFTELVDHRILGVSFAVRSVAGFGAGGVASWLFGVVLDWANKGTVTEQLDIWGWSFSALGAGAVVAILATVWLRALPESRRMAEGRR